MCKQAAFGNIYFELAFLLISIYFLTSKTGTRLIGRFGSTFTTNWQNSYLKFVSFATMADFLSRLAVFLPGLAILLPGLEDLLSKY